MLCPHTLLLLPPPALLFILSFTFETWCFWSLYRRAGVDSARVRQAGQIAGQTSTRRLGDYRVKLNYNDIDLLR